MVSVRTSRAVRYDDLKEDLPGGIWARESAMRTRRRF